MSKQIAIIGGGISGLSALHYLRRKYPNREKVFIRLIEQKTFVGGAVQSLREGGYLFEEGPNGFLDSKDSLLKLADELHLTTEMVTADASAKIRYVCVGGKLHAFPSSPAGMFGFKLFSLADKLRVPAEMFVARGTAPQESVYEFGKRRLGENFAKYFLDPMVSGIYAGDAQEIDLQSAFPRIHALEQTHGSLIRAMLTLKKGKNGQPGGQLRSFSGGMGQLIETLAHRYREDITTSETVRMILPFKDGVIVESDKGKYFADQLVMTVPAERAGELTRPFNEALGRCLARIRYAPVAVVGLAYPQSAFPKPVKGFGYLIPSSEEKEILGVLFCSNIFPGRCPDGEVLFRVMIGGTRNPASVKRTRHELFELAHAEIGTVLKTNRRPHKQFLTIWEKAIPQYTLQYPPLRERIVREMRAYPNFHLLGNYLNGVAMNDCVAAAEKLAAEMVLHKAVV